MRTTVNHHTIIRMMGVLFGVMGLAFLLPLTVALLYGEKMEAWVFAGCSALCIGAYLLDHRFFNPTGLKAKDRDGFLVVTVCWLVSSVIGSVPMVLTGAIPNPIDAFFEICSGFSTTGASILNDIEALPASVLMWRSFTHWLGGMGIIVFAAALLPSIGIGAQNVASAETPGPTLTKLSGRFSDTARKLYQLYLLFTVAQVLLLLLGDMNLYDALIHTFGTVGTGGFSNYSDSVGHFASPYIRWVIIVFMVLCGINFNLYFYLPKLRIREFFRDEELRLYLGIIGTFAVAATVVLCVQGEYTDPLRAFTDAMFHVVAVITTTGFATADFDLWPTFCKMLLFIVMITGACSSSTGGGAKLIRVLVAIKFVRRGFFLKLRPNHIYDLTINGRGVSQSVVTGIVNYLFFYVAVLLAGTVLISVDGLDLVTNLSAALTCLSNVGPGFNLVGPTMNFAIYSDFSTFVLALMMIAGRLELFTFFMIFSRHFWNSNRV